MPGAPPHLLWPEERVASLRSLWDDGLSAAQIAAKIGVSRNAVLGKADRMGLPDRTPPIPVGTRRWPASDIQKLRELAAAGLYVSAIATMIGVTRLRVLAAARRHRIAVILNSPAEQAAIDEMRAALEHRKSERRKANRTSVGVERTFAPTPGTSRTSAVYRNSLPRPPEMSKTELRAMLAQAVRNTVEIRA